MAASNMRFGHVQPLDYNFSYDNVLMLEHFRRALYIILFDTSFAFVWWKLVNLDKMAEKIIAKIRVFGLAQEHTGSCGSLNDGDVCHIFSEA